MQSNLTLEKSQVGVPLLEKDPDFMSLRELRDLAEDLKEEYKEELPLNP